MEVVHDRTCADTRRLGHVAHSRALVANGYDASSRCAQHLGTPLGLAQSHSWRHTRSLLHMDAHTLSRLYCTCFSIERSLYNSIYMIVSRYQPLPTLGLQISGSSVERTAVMVQSTILGYPRIGRDR